MDPGDMVMSSIYWKKGENASFRTHCLYYYATFQSSYVGLLFLYNMSRFSLFLRVFLKTKGIWSSFGIQGTGLLGMIYCKTDEKAVISKERVPCSFYYYAKFYSP